MQELRSSMPQSECLSVELTGIPVESQSADAPPIDLYINLHFDEAWQSLLQGRFKFGIKRGQLRLQLKNAQMPEEWRELNGAIATQSPSPIAWEIETCGTPKAPCWIFAAKTPQPVLGGSIETLKLGRLQVTDMPCTIQAIFEVSPEDVQLTDAEGLWQHDISPNKHAVLERKLAISLASEPLKPHFTRAIALQFYAPEEPPHRNSYATEDAANSPAELAETIEQVLSATTNDFIELAKIAGLNPLEDFAGAKLLGATLNGIELSGANLAGANLRGAELCDADLSEANLAGANLAGADLSGALLSDAQLTGADLHRCSLALATLSGANLAGANLREANLSNANLSDADLTNANLTGADLHRAGLMLTNLTGAELRDAKVEEARFRKHLGLSAQLQLSLQQGGAIFEGGEEDALKRGRS